MEILSFSLNFLPFLISFIKPFRVLVMFLTDTATFVSHRHSHISLHISSLSHDLFILLSMHFSNHMLQPLTASSLHSVLTEEWNPLWHYDHLSLSAFFFCVIFLSATNWSALTVVSLAATVIGRSIFYETFCLLLLFYYRQKSRGDSCSMLKQLISCTQ